MADIELVIRIPEGLKKDFELEQWTALTCAEMKNALKKGTILPKWHGRKFEEIVVEYPPAELCTYPEYKGKPYFSIKYEENEKHIIGFGTYKPEVLSEYLREYFIAQTNIENVGEMSEKQTDGDLISRTELLNKIWQKEYGKDYDGVNTLNIPHIDIIENMPSAEKTAEWIKQKSGDELFPEEIVCSKCYHSNSHLDFDEHNNPIGKLFLKSKYCPNCGRRMLGVEE